jgi:hypothetical protein
MIYSLEEAPLEKNWKTPADLGKLRADCFEAFGEKKAEGAWETYKALIVRSSSMVGLVGTSRALARKAVAFAGGTERSMVNTATRHLAGLSEGECGVCAITVDRANASVVIRQEMNAAECPLHGWNQPLLALV